MDVGGLKITVDLSADDLGAEISKAVEKQLEPVLAKIREQINQTARDLNKINGKQFIEVAIDAKAAEREITKQGNASAKAAAENEANAKAVRDLARAEAEFAAAQKSGDLVARSAAMAKLTQAMGDYEKVTGRSASASRDFADQEVKNLDSTVKATERKTATTTRAAQRAMANEKAVQDAIAKTAKAAEDAADRRAKSEQRVRDEIGKTEKVADEAARRAAERARAGGGGGGGGRGGGGGGGSGGGEERGAYHGFITRAALNPIGANLIGLGLAGIPAATQAITTLGASIAQVAASGLEVPGILAGIGASAGTAALGLSGMKKAVTDLNTAITSDDPQAMKKATEDMKDMAPAAQDTAKAIAALATGPLRQLRQEVQAKMFAGTADEIKHLSDVLIPHLTTGMGSVATAWNRTFKALGAAAGSSGNLNLLDQIFGNTAQAQTRANAAIAPLVDGMGKLATTGTAFLPRLADGLTKVSMRFDAFINKSVSNGNLDKWIDDGISGLTKLGNAGLNFGKTLENIFKAAGGGDGFLTWLQTATQRWAQFTGSAKGQNQLSEFFKSAREDMARWEPVLGNLFKLLGQIIGGAQAWSAVMLPFLQSASSLLLHMPGLVSAITVAFLAWRTMSGISSVLNMIGGLNKSLDAVPAKAKVAGAAIAEMDVEDDIAGSGTGGGTGGGRRRRGGRGGGRMGRLGMGASALGLGLGVDQLFAGVDPAGTDNQGAGGWVQSAIGGAGSGAAIGTMIEPGIGTAVGAAVGLALGPALKGIENLLRDPPGEKPLVPGALTGHDYQNALNMDAFTAGPGGAPWNQKMVDQAVYGASGSFDPRNSPFSAMNKGDANYQSTLAEMQKPGGAYSSIPGLTADNAPQYLDRILKQAHDAAGALNSLGGEITDLPSGEVVITDPTPQILDRIRSMGGELHALPSGLIAVDTTQLNDAEKKTDELHAKLAKLLVPGMQLDPTNPNALVPAGPSNYGTPADLPPALAGLFPGGPGSPIGHASGGVIRRFASGGVMRRYDEGGDVEGGGSPWRVAAQIGSQFIDEAAMAGIKLGQGMLRGGSGALSTAADIAGKVIGPVGIAAPFVMDAIDPQARTTPHDTLDYTKSMGMKPWMSGVGGIGPGGVLPGYSPGVDNLMMPGPGGNYALGGGEGIIIPEAMKAIGAEGLYQLNSKFRPGLSRENYATGGIVGSFKPGGVIGGPNDPTNDQTEILKSISALLGGTKSGPLAALAYSSQIQQMYLQRIATGGALNGTLAPGTTPGKIGPWGSPVKPINIGEALARGAIQGLGGNPDIIFGQDSVDRAIGQSNEIEQALRQAAGQPGGIAALSRPTDPGAYVGPLTQFAQTGQITEQMRSMGLDVNSPVVSAINSARGEKGYEQLPALIAQSLGGAGYTGPLTKENQSILGALGTFRDSTSKNALSQQQLNMTLAPYGGLPGLPNLLQQNPNLLSTIPGLAGGAGMPGAGGAPNSDIWDKIAAAESSGRWNDDNTGGHSTSSGAPRGGLQITDSTWSDWGGTAFAPNAAAATKEQQIEIAQRIANGWNGKPGRGLEPWQAVTDGKVPGVTANTPVPNASYPVMPQLAGPQTPITPVASPTDMSTGTAPPDAWWFPAENTWKLNGQPVAGAPPAAGAPFHMPPAGNAPPVPAPSAPAPPPPPPNPLDWLAHGQPAPTGGLPGLLLPGLAPSGIAPPSPNAPGNPSGYGPAPAVPPPSGAVPDTTKKRTPVPGVPGKWISADGDGKIYDAETGGTATGETWGVPPGGWQAAVIPPGSALPPVVAPYISGPPVAPASTAGVGVPAMTSPIVPLPPAAPGTDPRNFWGAPITPAGGMLQLGGNLPDVRGAHPQLAYAFQAIKQMFPTATLNAGDFDHPADQGWHGKGQAIDIGAPGNDPATLNSISTWLQQFAPYIEEEIHQGVGAGGAAVTTNIKSGKLGPAIDQPGSVYNTGQAGYHGDHVHLAVTDQMAQAFEAALAGGGAVPPGLMGAGGPGGAPGYPGSSGAFGAGGLFGSGGGTVPVMVTNWPGGMGGGGGGGLFGGGPAGQQAAQILGGVAAPVLGAAGSVAGDVAGDAINATPGALQSVFESKAGMNAPGVQVVSALNQHDPIQAILAGAGINVPDMSRNGATQLGGASFGQNAGPGYDATGRLLSATTGLYTRTSTDLNAHLDAMKDQFVGATTSVGDKLTKQALTPLLKAGVSAGMGAIPSAVLASMGTQLGTAMAPPIASAIGSGGSSSNASTASDISAIPLQDVAAIGTGLTTTFAASGGPMTGGTAGVDSVPVMAMPGEWMMTTDEVNKMGGFSGMKRFTEGLSKSHGVRMMAAGGGVIGGNVTSGTANPGTASTGTAGLGGDYFGVSQVPILGPILDILLNILLAMMGINVTVRDTMLNLTDNFRQFRGDSFKAFDAQGRLMNDTSGLIDRSVTSRSEVTDERVRILTQVLEGVITYIINKVVIPLSEAVAQAAINAAASAGGGALNAIAPGAGSAAGAAASALGDASVQIAGQIGGDFFGAAVPAIGDALGTALIQGNQNGGLESIFGGTGTPSAPTAVDTGSLNGAITGGLAALLLPLLGLGALAVTDNTGALFDEGGLASGVGMLPKATVKPERVLSPQQTDAFERLVGVLEGGTFGGNNTTTIHAPFHVSGNAEGGQAVRNSLLSLLDK